MDLALFKVLGAGLAALAPTFGAAVPDGGVEAGLRLVDHLLQCQDDATRADAEALMQDVWRDWSELGLEPAVAEPHLAALPQLLEHTRLDADFVSDAVLAGSLDDEDGSTARSAARRIAIDLLARFDAAGAMAEHQLDDPTVSALLEQLFARLLATGAISEALQAEIITFFDPPGADQPEQPIIEMAAPTPVAEVEPASAPQPPGADLVRIGETEVAIDDLARGLNTPVPVLRLVISTVAYKGVAPDQTMHVIAEVTAAYRTLIDDLAKMAERDTLSGASIRSAIAAIKTAYFTDADEQLGQAEESALHAAQSDIEGAAAYLSQAAALRSSRAVLAQVRLDYRRAARHCWSAARCLPLRNKGERWRLARQQVALLMREVEITRDPTLLAEAIEVLVGALPLAEGAPEQDALARTKFALGDALMAQGVMVRAADSLSDAIRNFRDAIELFSQKRLMDDWAAAQIKLGDAFEARGRLTGAHDDPVQAVAAWRAAAGIVTRERLPILFAETHYKIGRSLLDQADVDPSRYDAAIGALRIAASVPGLSGDVRDKITVDLVRAELRVARTRGDQTAERQALDAFRDVLPQLEGVLEPMTWACMQHEYASALWRHAATSGELASFSAAAQAMMAALDAFETAGAEIDAQAARDALGQIYADMSQRLVPPKDLGNKDLRKERPSIAEPAAAEL